MDLDTRLRAHPGALSVPVSVAALAAVFAAAGGVVPPPVLPTPPAAALDVIPHVNAAVSAVAALTVVAGVREIHRGRVARHRALMIAATALFVVFLALYLYKVALRGPAAFGGPDTVYRFVYLPVLVVHVLLAVVTVPLVTHALVLAGLYDISELPSTRHPTVGRAAAVLWVVSYALGEVVYLLLYVVY